jgi:hypothetical protein
VSGRLGGGLGSSLQSRVGKAKQSRFVPYKKSKAEKKNLAIGAEKKAGHKKDQRNLIERLEAKQAQRGAVSVIMQQSSFDPHATAIKPAFAFAKPTFSLANDSFTAVRPVPQAGVAGGSDKFTAALDTDAKQTADHERQVKAAEGVQKSIASAAAKQVASGQGGGSVNVFGALGDGSSGQKPAGLFQFSAPTFAFGNPQSAVSGGGVDNDL